MQEAEARLQAADEREQKVRGLTDKPTFSHTFWPRIAVSAASDIADNETMLRESDCGAWLVCERGLFVIMVNMHSIGRLTRP